MATHCLPDCASETRGFLEGILSQVPAPVEDDEELYVTHSI